MRTAWVLLLILALLSLTAGVQVPVEKDGVVRADDEAVPAETGAPVDTAQAAEADTEDPEAGPDTADAVDEGNDEEAEEVDDTKEAESTDDEAEESDSTGDDAEKSGSSGDDAEKSGSSDSGSSDSGADDGDTEEKAVKAFSLECITCGENEGNIYDDVYYGDGDPIFRDEELQGDWKSCTEDSGRLSSKNCFVEDQYTDRINFEFWFGYSDLYSFEDVVVKGDQGDAHPEIKTVFLDQDYNGYIAINYNCEASDNETTVITLTFPITKNYSITFRWLKVCGSGRNDKVEIGFRREDDSGETVPFSKEDLLVSAADLSTKIYMIMKPPAVLQTFLAPEVETDTDLVDVIVRGAAAKGGEIYTFGSEFEVNYECHGDVLANVSLTVQIPPWDPLIATWQKNCGATPASGLTIGTTPTEGNVLQGGVLSPAFEVDFSGDMSSTDGQYVVPKEDLDITFYLKNEGKSSSDSITIHAISLTVPNPPVFKAEVTVPRYANQYLTDDGDFIKAGEEKKLQIRLVCIQEGQSTVLVTLATYEHGNVEFGFSKECDKPMKITESGFLKTSNSLFLVMLVLIGLFLVLIFFGARKYGTSAFTTRRSYAPVEVRE